MQRSVGGLAAGRPSESEARSSPARRATPENGFLPRSDAPMFWKKDRRLAAFIASAEPVVLGLLTVEVVAAFRLGMQIPGRFCQLLKCREELGGFAQGRREAFDHFFACQPLHRIDGRRGLAVSNNEPTWVAASLPVCRSMTWA